VTKRWSFSRLCDNLKFTLGKSSPRIIQIVSYCFHFSRWIFKDALACEILKFCFVYFRLSVIDIVRQRDNWNGTFRLTKVEGVIINDVMGIWRFTGGLFFWSFWGYWGTIVQQKNLKFLLTSFTNIPLKHFLSRKIFRFSSGVNILNSLNAHFLALAPHLCHLFTSNSFT
jgi:hypothetical protein